MKRTILLAPILAATLPILPVVQAAAQEMAPGPGMLTGNDLLSLCLEDRDSQRERVGNSVGSNACFAYLGGVADSMSGGSWIVWGHRSCVPVGASYGQLRDVIVQHLQSRPATRHWIAASSVAAAMAGAFPCR